MKKLTPLLTTIVALAFHQVAFAALQTYTVSLDSAQENNPANTSPATGSGTLTFDDAANTLTFNGITWSGLQADSTAAHIHGPAATGAPAGVLYFLFPTYTQVGSGIRSGTISGTLPLVDGTGGFTLAQQISQLQGSLWYINIHSDASQGGFPGGEIRGQIVPEPSTWALLGLGAGALAWRLRRRK